MEQKISVVINTYNAEQHLAKVLDAVKDFDEIVICDMESTDSTLDIARQYGCKIVTFEKKDYTIKFKCKNEKQKDFYNLLKDDSKVISAALGSPGSGKSYVSLAYALQALKSGKYKRIICFVPTAPAGASALQIGYLKGTLEDKI